MTTGQIEFQRVTTREQYDSFRRCLTIGFQQPFAGAEQWAEAVVAQLDVIDHRVAVDGGQTVGTFLSYDQLLTAVGGCAVPVRAISGVTVLPTHRRRGILRTHMRDCLAAAHARGLAAATLVASEYPIYGRYGFGPAGEVVDYRIVVDRAALPEPPVDQLRYVDGEEYLAAAASVRANLCVPGFVSTLDVSARRSAGLLGTAGSGPDVLRLVLRRAGAEVGVLSYSVTTAWSDTRPDAVLKVRQLFGVDAAAERDLWAFAMSVDWVVAVEASARPLDDIVTTVPVDPRAVHVSNRADLLWIRPLDVPALFASRGYAAPGRLVLEVTDHGFDGAGPGPAHGRFVIESDGGAGTCIATDEPADLALDVLDLGRLWLFDEPVSRRVGTGHIRELTAGAAARADVMLFSARRPWAGEIF